MNLLRSPRGKPLAIVLISFISISLFYTNCSTNGFEPLQYDQVNLSSASGETSGATNPSSIPGSDTSFSVHNAEAIKGQPLNFKIELSKVADKDITISVKTEPDTAVPFFDYNIPVSQVTIPAGKTSVFVTIDSLNFDNAIIDKSFKLVVSRNSSGALGQNVGIGTIKRNSQKLILKAITANSINMCGITASNTVVCRMGVSAIFKPIQGLLNVKQVSMGFYHFCALTYTGTVQCWGSNYSGELGNNTTTNSDVPVEVSGLSNVKQISLGKGYSCALLNTGIAKCWGDNSSGQLGNKTTVDSSTPVAVSDLSEIKQISAGNSHVCAALNSASVKCWGNNVSGQLGNNSTTNTNIPVTVTGLSDVTQVSSGGNYTCAILNSATAKCWGDNYFGQLGNKSYKNSLVPVDVFELSEVSQISLNSSRPEPYSYISHTCALLKSSTVKCWGYNAFGELGNNSTKGTIFYSSNTPVNVIGLSEVDQVTLGDAYSCARTTTGTVNCWGSNRYGELGFSHLTSTFHPLNINDSEINTQSVELGYDHSCNITNTNTARCWGLNYYGQLGDSTKVDSLNSVTVKDLNNIKQIKVGRFHTCALLSSGTIKCWGQNYDRQLGANVGDGSASPVDVSGLSDISEISLGSSHSCALSKMGTVKCWGDNISGQLGNTSNFESEIPIDVGLSNVKQISLGADHSCALLITGTVKCWGDNYYGQLGNNSFTKSGVPVEVIGLSDVKKISMGYNHSCALLNSGVVKCWGSSFFEQTGSESQNSSPLVKIAELDSIKEVQAGINFSCALTVANDLKCWGKNSHGQFGTSTYNTEKNTPKLIMKAKSFKLGGSSLIIERLDGVHLRTGSINPYYSTPVELMMPLD